MLTKQDLQEIGKLLKPLKDEVKDIREDLRDTKSDLKMSIFSLKAEVKEDMRIIKRRLGEIYDNQNTL